MRQSFRLVHEEARRRALQAVQEAPHGAVVEVRPDTRTLAQNALMWARLTDVSRQVVWYGERLMPVEWKIVFTAALRKQRAVPGIDGGFVVLGEPTSSMTKRDMSDLMEVMAAFAAEREVVFREPDWRWAR